MTEDYAVILLAAGSASRFSPDEQVNKVLMLLNERPVFDYSLRLFLKDKQCERILLVVKKEEQLVFQSHLKSLYGRVPEKISFVPGGRERQDSVGLALAELKEDSGYVLVHDAARPFLTVGLIERLLSELSNCEAIVPVVPVTDSLKQIDGETVVRTLYRSKVKRVQTPQAFSVSLLKKAYQQANKNQFYGNEEGELVERLGHQVKTVSGEEINFKLTTQLDYQIAIGLVENDEPYKMD